MWPRFGIKIGNTTFCIAYIKADGKADVIANKQGDRVSQACLLWDGNDEIECGLTAKQKMANKPKQGIANSLQILLCGDELKDEALISALKRIPCEYDAKNNSFTLKCTNPETEKDITKEISAFDAYVHLFKAELELARQYHSNLTEKPIVVLSIPGYYPRLCWPILAEAAEKAGFHVAQIMRESTAALLAYGIGENNDAMASQTKYILTIKSGGNWSNCSIYMVRDGFYTEIETHEPFPIGGARYDDALVNFICEEFYKKYKLNPKESRRSIAKIKTAASNCKHILTALPSTQVYIDSLMDGIDFNMQMSRARFESLIQPVIVDFLKFLSDFVDSALKKHPEIERIDSIVLLGATMQIPKLQNAISSRYPDAQIQTHISTDEAAAIGCARQSMYLIDPNEQWVLEVDEESICTEEKVLIWHEDDEENAVILLDKGAILPKTVHIGIKPSQSELKETNTFHLRAGENLNKVTLNEANLAEDGMFQLEAEIDWEDEEESMRPIIKLRCL